MPSLEYRVDGIKVIGSAAFSEASKEELRVLLALIELSGEAESVSALAELSHTSPARCRAAIAFWEESGVIIQKGEPRIIDEFEERLVRGEIDEKPATQVAQSIRNDSLAGMIEECGLLMKQVCLSNDDVKKLTALHTQYNLSPDYIVELAAHMAKRGYLTVKRLCDEAIRLQNKGCDTQEALEAYLAELESTGAAEWEFRRLLGIYGRTLSESERAYFKKWSEDYGYSVGIVSLAYDIAVLNTRTGRGDLRYMDSLLTAWYQSGCRTVQDCRDRIEADKAKKKGEPKSAGAKKKSKSTPETPRYGNFDINEAFNDAVARSFGSDEDDEGGEE